jgi:3-hydroxyisobutyrate dehydrogenase
MPRVAVVGLGAMGSRMARRLLDAGHDVSVWNRTPERAGELGLTSAPSPADAARGAEFAITMVSDPAALAEVTEGDDGVLAGSPGVLIQMSTVGVEATERLRAAATVPLLDAPVLGSRAEAEAAKLVIFASGDDDVFERARPILEVLGTPLRVSDGQRAKLVANGVLVGTIAVLGEALVLARALGLDDDTTWQVLAKTPLGAQAERRREQLAAGDFPPRFALSLARKDAQLIEQTGAEAEVGAAARRYLEQAERDGYGDNDYAVVLRWLLEHFA